MKDTNEIIGLIAGIFTSSALVPQLVTTIKKKKAQDMSALLFLVMLTGNALWTYYGIQKSDFPIIATNIFSVLLNTIMLFLKFKYRKNK